MKTHEIDNLHMTGLAHYGLQFSQKIFLIFVMKSFYLLLYFNPKFWYDFFQVSNIGGYNVLFSTWVKPEFLKKISQLCVPVHVYFLYYFVVCSFVRKSAKLSSLYSWKISFPYLLSVEASALITKRLWYTFLLEVCK